MSNLKKKLSILLWSCIFIHLLVVSTVATELTIIAVGDIMLGTDYPRNRLPADDGKQLLADVQDTLQNADITFGNLEGVLLDGGNPAKTCNNPDLCYLFRTPTHYVDNLVTAGFDVMSLANNHARDFGESGRTVTMETLTAAGIHHSGRVGDIASWEVKGMQCAMIAFTANPGSYSILDVDTAVAEVKQLAETHDIVLVSFHGGAEGSKATHVPHQMETYYGEQRGNVVAFSHAVIDAGADVVIGHGPHVPRAVELYKDRFIAYSLGNFCTYQGINVSGILGVAPILQLKIDEDGSFLEGKIISAYQKRPVGTVLDSTNKASQVIRELTETDFPNTPLQISTDGVISYRHDLKESKKN